MRRWLTLLLALLALVGAGVAGAQDLLAVPAIEGRRVIDTSGTLTAEQTVSLTSRLAAIEAQRGTQIVVLIVPSVTPEDITDFAQRVGDAWKLGRAQVGDGLLIVVAKNDRKVRVAPAKALEGAIPDVIARRIITEQISPAFRAGDYAGGLAAAIEKIDQRLSGEALPEPDRKGDASRGAAGFDWQDLAIFLFVGAPIAGAFLKGIFGRKLGTAITSAGIGGIGWWLTASALVAGGAALLTLLLVGVMGMGAGGRRSGGFGPGPVIWGVAAVGAADSGAVAAVAASARAAAAISAAAAPPATGEAMGTMNRWRRILAHRWVDEGDARRMLDAAAMARLQARVAASEQHHSGEIRICIEAGLPMSYLWRGATARERAIAVFGKLRVWDTEANNGVLIYLLLAEHAIEIVADRGVARQVDDTEWAAIAAGMRGAFRAGRFAEGLDQAVDAVDALLRRHFPLAPGATNPNELSDAPHWR